MNIKKLQKAKLRRQRRNKYTAMSSAITALLIALVIVFNMGFFALASHFTWYADMTKDQVYSLYDATLDLLRDVEGETNIYFTVEPDKIRDASPYLFYVYQTALQLESKFDNIHVECVDIVKNPGFFKEYYTTAAQDIKTTSVVVKCGTEFRLFNMDAFFVHDEEYSKIWGYQAEQKFVSAILSMTSAKLPVVHMTTQHGEAVDDNASALVSLFTDAGYTVKNIDLSKEEIDEDARIVVINNPIYDFAGIEADSSDANEIDKLDRFLDDYGCLMVFTSPEYAGNLTNLSELLSEWGIGFNGDTYMRDTANAISTDGKAIVAQYAEKDTLGASLYLDLLELDQMPKTILRNAMPLNILWENDPALEGTKVVSPVLWSHDSAQMIRNGKTVSTGAQPLMTISREGRIENNEYYYSYVLVSGSADYTDPAYLLSSAYGNRDILYNTMRLTGRDRIIADIEMKVLDDTSMDITTAQANRWTVALTVTMPVLIGAVGLVVHIRRRNG